MTSVHSTLADSNIVMVQACSWQSVSDELASMRRRTDSAYEKEDSKLAIERSMMSRRKNMRDDEASHEMMMKSEPAIERQEATTAVVTTARSSAPLAGMVGSGGRPGVSAEPAGWSRWGEPRRL